jgi:N-acyl-D-amino-acid deacylase
VRQGITLQVTGNCGRSAAPISEENRELSLQFNLGGYEGYVTTEWFSFEEYLDQLQTSGTAINVASLVGQATIRVCVMSHEQRKPNEDELDTMRRMVARSMEEGAFGISAGLTNAPSGNAETEELVELCKIVAKYGGVYFTHQREYGSRFIKSTLETIKIAERSGVSVHPVHHKPIIHEFQGETEDTLKIIDDARERGIDITCDVYPYIWASSGLDGILPYWVLEEGPEKTMEILKNPKMREKIKKDMVDPKLDLNMGYIARTGAWNEVILLHLEKSKQFIGKTLLEVAKVMDLDPIDAALEVFIIEGMTNRIPVVDRENTKEMLLELFVHPTYMVGSDGSALAPYGILGEKMVHPRSYGCYPRILGRWVRDERLISMEEAIRKTTSLPAQLLGLRDRGLIREGMWADIVVFDPKTVIDKATFENPHQYPEGIKYVIVNGEIVINDEEHTGALSGKVLRGSGYIINKDVSTKV